MHAWSHIIQQHVNKVFSEILVVFFLYTLSYFHVAITYRDIQKLTERPFKRGTFFHCATIISIPKKPFPVSASIKLLTLFIWEKYNVESANSTEPVLLMSIFAANGATMGNGVGPGRLDTLKYFPGIDS